ncbi:hypothetical protein ACOMHN_010596 [Nucella lapillus]
MFFTGIKRKLVQRLGGRGRILRALCTKGAKTCRVLRNLFRRRLVKVGLFLSILIYLVLMLHLRVLPKASGAYNEDCFLQEARKERMRFVLRHVVQFLNEENATYWLDFGTFLGAIREGDIIAHDGDMDVSRLANDLQADRRMMSRFTDKMREVGIEGSEMTAKYQDVQVDMFRWQTDNSSSQRPWIRIYYPFVPAWRLAEVISNFFFPPDFSSDLLFPLRKISVVGVYANIPNRIIDYLKHRYPLTWYVTFPYKWKCWWKKK